MKCRFTINFNQLGMPMFSCRVHKKIKGKYLQLKCLNELNENKRFQLMILSNDLLVSAGEGDDE